MNSFRVVLVFLILSIESVCAQQPNVLWITIEDTSPQFIGSYGNSDSRTPVMDQLTREGVQFTNAFSTGTVCSPSRSAIITGIKTYELGTGNHRSNYSIPAWLKGFPYYLKQAGYYVTNNSKTDYNVANEKQFIAEAWNESSGKAGWWDREEGQPFFSVFNFNESHQSRTMTHPYEWYVENVLEMLPEEDRIAEDEFEMPPFYRDSPEMRKQMARVYNSLKLTDNRIGDLLERLREDGLLQETIIFIFADHGEGMPRGKTNGINFGYRVPFTIWFPPKYEHLSPWGINTRTDELMSFEDLAPTMISLAGGKVPDYLKGRVLLGENRSPKADKLFLSSDRSDNGIDMIRTVTDGRFVYSRNFMPYMPEARYIRYMEIGEIKQIMRIDLENGLLNSIQESIFQSREPEVLYDIENDSWETNNLVGNSEYQDVLVEMRSALKAHLLERKDVLMLPEGELDRISKTTSPYEFRESESDFPFEAIYAAAKLSGFRSSEILAQQIDLLESSNPILRYWAAIGLKSQSKEALKANLAELEEKMNDDYPYVSATLASIVYEINQAQESQEILKKSILSEDKHLSLMAINYLLYSEHKSPFIEPIREVYERQGEYNSAAASKDFLGSLGLIPNDFENR
ncbi:sulfatase family protein [Algoriphagus zhangzhouensis]|uniref:Arylsulfatase A n=1 Tax=Algoriphagus zhangzhouensis TaxID=1073327 RepID=A0A1M7Z4N8_9BACT|nr:sulfatase [Algoriphagus zhangzhouensis]TDY48757.1 arylsulfatase A-like enzyme [Algoriphagus zhangzhouensis]SHO59908.1 Arylsulfatase A [Algoriphagus zhangzhouensis]